MFQTYDIPITILIFNTNHITKKKETNKKGLKKRKERRRSRKW